MGGGGPNSGELSKLSSLESMALGVVAGMGCKSLNYPLLSWKNTVQQGLPISFQPKIVYRGLPMAMMNLGGTTGVQFFAVSGVLKVFQNNGFELNDKTKMSAAFTGGVISALPCSVWELTMIQQQRFGGSIASTPMRIISNYGIPTIARGMTMTMGREGLYTLGMLGATPVLRQFFIDQGLQQEVALGVSSLSAALVSCAISHPMDTIKTCMQGDVGREKYTTVTKTAKMLAEEYGVAQGLFKGAGLRALLVATTFFLVNQIKIVLAPAMFPHINEKHAAATV